MINSAHCAVPVRKSATLDSDCCKRIEMNRPGRRGCFHPRPPQSRTCTFPATLFTGQNNREIEPNHRNWKLPCMSSLDDFAQAKLTALESRHLRRVLMTSMRHDGVIVERGGRRLVSFSCNDYLGLSGHPALAEAARAAIEKFGVGAGASRLVTGNHPLYDELEARLARLKGTAAACVFGSGYLANTGIVPALVGDGDLVAIDELAHACLYAGARLSGATVMRFPHNDV